MSETTTSTDRLLGRVEQAIINLNETMERIADEQKNHGDRLDKLENRQSWLKGAGYVIAAVAAYVTAKLNWLPF